MSQRDQTHGMVPSGPQSQFVIGHAQIHLSVFEVRLHIPTSAADHRHRLPGRFCLGIADVVVRFCCFVERATKDNPDRRPSAENVFGLLLRVCNRAIVNLRAGPETQTQAYTVLVSTSLARPPFAPHARLSQTPLRSKNTDQQRYTISAMLVKTGWVSQEPEPPTPGIKTSPSAH